MAAVSGRGYIEAAAGDHEASGNDRRDRSEQFFGHCADDDPRILFGIVLQQIAHDVSWRMRAIASAAND